MLSQILNIIMLAGQVPWDPELRKGHVVRIARVFNGQMSLRISFMLVAAFLFIVSAAGVTWSVRLLAESIVEQWTPRYIAKQALYEKGRTLQPILREVALSRQLASSQFLKNFARDPENNALRAAALEELENYRLNFQDKSYFVALRRNGYYYHNNADNEFAGNEFRYVLDPGKQADAWFYDLIRQRRDIHINVNPDEALGITKLWIDVLIRDGNNILGITGTGLDLTQFLADSVEETEPGITSFFVDHSGDIQLHHDVSYIDFGSVSKKDGTHKTIDLIFKNDEDRRAVYTAMKELEAGEKNVATVFVEVAGKRELAGIVYLPEIDWHQITLIDLGTVLPLSIFSMTLLVYIVSLLIALFVFNFVLNRFVLTPLRQLDRAMGRVEAGRDPHGHVNPGGLGEVGRLVGRFLEMARVVLTSKRDLEQQVKDRTADLERLTKVDPLTDLLNRRGMTEHLESGLSRAEREDAAIGILWIDVDWFKEINDTYGHPVGDKALKAVAGCIKRLIRPYDLAARWGGDEFLVMLQPAESGTLEVMAERIRASVAQYRDLEIKETLSISIGGSLSGSGQDLTQILQNADQALYLAKEAGRNCYRAADFSGQSLEEE